MPEWNEKKKRLEDWMGRPVTPEQEAQQKRTTNYLYDMYNIGANVRGIEDPLERAKIVGDLQKNLQAQYYGRKGVEEDLINKAGNVEVEKLRGGTLRDVANIQATSAQEVAKLGQSTDSNMDLAMALLGGRDQGSGIKIPSDTEPAKVTTLASPEGDKKKKEKEDEIQKALGVLKPYFPGGEPVGDLPNLGIKLFKKPDEESWLKDAFR